MAMTPEERLARQREQSRLYAERSRRKAGVPVRKRISKEETKANRNARARERRAANPEPFRAKSRKYMEKIRLEQPEKILAWRANFVRDEEKRDQYNKSFREKIKHDPERYAAYLAAKRNWEARNADAIRTYKADWVCKKNMANVLGCSVKEIPTELLDAKMAFINVKRKLKELNK